MTAILNRIAALHTPATKKDATALVRKARQDGMSLPKARQDELAARLVELAAHVREVRSTRRRVAPKQPSWLEQVQARTVAAVKAAKKGLYRYSSHDHALTVTIGNQPSARNVAGTCYPYKGNSSWMAAVSSEHRIVVRKNWLVSVEARGLAVVDGMLTLDARPVQGHGPELFEATWVVQGKGYEISTEHGYIARIDGTTYHAKTARAALDGVQRKAGLKPQRRKGVIDLDKWSRKCGDLPVYFADSSAVGNCESGTVNWCHAVGISTDETTLREVIAGYKLRPLPEALAVIRRVIRDRHNRQPMDLSDLNGAAGLVGEGRVIFDSEGGFRIENN